MQWFRHYVDAGFDPKFRTVARRAEETLERVVFVWWTVCEHAAGHDGDITGYDPELVADHLMCNVSSVSACLRELRNAKLLSTNGVSNWHKRQHISDTSTERVRRWRERKAAEAKRSETSHVTDVTDQNRTEQNRESESRTDSESPGENQNPTHTVGRPTARRVLNSSGSGSLDADFADWWALWSIPGTKRKEGRARPAYRSARKKASKDTLADGVRRDVEGWKRKGTETRFIPHPASWLNAESWKDEIDEQNINGHGRTLTPEELKNVASQMGLGFYTDEQKAFLRARGLWDARQGGPPGWAKAQLR